VPKSRINFLGRGHWQGHYALLSNLSRSLAGQTEMDGRPIVDKTGLTGHADIVLKWSDEAAAEQGGPNAVSLFTAIEEQLGLKLQPSKGPVETLVIDHVEMPSED
jgi:uncharacterized protein (TIGR03435 family)